MGRTIDCLLIGHNEMDFMKYEKTVGSMGKNSGAYRDLNLNFLQHNNKLYTVGDVFNEFCYGNEVLDNSMGPYSLGNLFSLAIAYLASYLHRRGFTFEYVNNFQDEKGMLADILENNNILTIAIPTTLYVTAFPLIEIISFVKKHNSSAKIIVGGPFVATQLRAINDEMLMQMLFKSINADFYINSSQGEAALASTVNAVKNGLSYDTIDNLTYRYGDTYIANKVSTEDNKLEENPVDWSLFKDRLTSHIAIRTSISCPFSCAFCGFPQHAGKYQTACIEHVERELNAIRQLGKVKTINIIDDTFNVPPERFKDILRMMIKNDYDFNWNCNFRCQFLDEEMIRLLKESRCEGVLLGIESASDKILSNMNKNVTVDKYKRGLTLLNEHGITSYGSFFIGFPGETLETVKETANFIEEYRPTFFRTQLWYCEPITPIYKEKDKYKITGSQFKWSHATMNSDTASDIVEDLFMKIKNTVWVPQYNFEFYSIFNLLNMGMTLDNLKTFLNAFNYGVKEKYTNKGQQNISSEAINKLKAVFDKETDKTDEKLSIKKYDAEFDF